MKWFIISFLFLCSVLSGKGQSLNVNDLIKLTSMDYEQAKVYLVKEKLFLALPNINAEGTVVAQFSKNDIKGITELIVKSEWQDTQRMVHPYVHYDVGPKSCAGVIIEQLKLASFSLISKESDRRKSVWLYQNEKFMISLYTFTEKKLPASIDIHVK